ncbi:MAG: dipicolinate synthase subunit DpsA [Firmicutes bacterium]|nr:dipicolinate synthase subunit DpsA [Bacillota bacterium]
MKFAVIGGDLRAARLCALLCADGHEVRAFALEKAELDAEIISCADPAEAAQDADCAVLPLPVTNVRGRLNTPLSARACTVAEALDALTPEQIVCAGRVDAETWTAARARHLTLIDFFEREELCVLNAVATAEGAVGILMQETPVTLWGMRILVIGFGRVGKLLADRLKGLGARVAVSARNHGDMAWIRALNYEALDTRALEGQLGQFDAVVNTVPAPVLGENRLRELKPGALCMDLASKPGGMDFAAAGKLGVRAVWALSLPGEVAPVSAGTIIRDTIYNILGERV